MKTFKEAQEVVQGRVDGAKTNGDFMDALGIIEGDLDPLFSELLPAEVVYLLVDYFTEGLLIGYEMARE